MSGMATAAVAVDTKPRAPGIVAAKAMLLPAAFAAALAAVALVPSVQAQPRLVWSILGAAATLGIATVALGVASRGRTFVIDVVLRPQHYLQACAQGSVLLYWGWYWRPVYEAVPLLIAQLLFAYAFDIVLAWARRNTYTLGFAPFPVIFSINLFLWFKPEWFYLQFLMIAVGFAAKELIRWDKEGRRAHIFNPSSFPLAVFSLGLILTGTTSMTYGPEIAVTQFNPPYIYLFLFLIGLPGQYLFGVTTMTMSAVVTTYLFGVVYYWATGTYFFIDSYIPIAVFLGMHLLFTDPSTSPRSELGRIIFGVMYGLGNVILYEIFRQTGVPSFYDKLLPVPIMNLSIKLIDRAARSSWLSRFDPARLGASMAPRRRNLVFIGIWTTVFVFLYNVDGVGDHHPGHRVPFWQNACQADRPKACETLALILDTYCDDGSGWACNELGALRWHGRVEARPAQVGSAFTRGCTIGLAAACQNAIALSSEVVPPRQVPPRMADYPVILRTGKGPIPDRAPFEWETLACEQGFITGCENLAGMYLRGSGVATDKPRAADLLERACASGLASSCSNFGLMLYTGDGIPRDQSRGLAQLKRACDLGASNACRWLKERKSLPGATEDASAPSR